MACTNGEDCGEGAGKTEMHWVAGKLRSSHMSREVGVGGWGFNDTAEVKPVEFDVDGNAPCTVDSG